MRWKLFPRSLKGRVILGLVLFAGIVVVPRIAYRLCGPAVVSDALVGQSETEITRQYGKPDRDEEGYSILGAQFPDALPPGPIRTVIIHPCGLLHPEGGTLWVWYKQEGENWVCFQSCWYADSVQF